MPLRTDRAQARLTGDECRVLREALDSYILEQDRILAIAKGIRRDTANAARWRLYIAQQLRNEV